MTIWAPLLRPSVPWDKLKGFASLPLADDYLTNCHVTVDILVQLDAFWKFMLPNQVLQDERLVFQESVFGWVLSGSWTAPDSHTRVSPQLLCVDGISKSGVHKFWNLESMGVASKEATCNEKAPNHVWEKFNETVKFSKDRYEVLYHGSLTLLSLIYRTM